MIPNINPATGGNLGDIPRMGKTEVDAAVEAAKQPWTWTLSERCAFLRRSADVLESKLDAFAALETEDTGKPITTSSTIDIPRAIANLRFFADFAEQEQLATNEMEEGRNRTHRAPIGIVGLITPWNLPLYLLTWKLAPALAMGNKVIAKPSELTPRTAQALRDLMVELGLPEHVFQVVHGYGHEAGAALVEHSDVAAISFTGGTETGKIVAASAAPSFKKLSLELGGKNPGIVFADADLDVAVPGIARAAFTNQGQVCLCSSRILVEEEIYDEFKERLLQELSTWVHGDPKNPETKLGALISEAHRDKVHGFVSASTGSVLCGGRMPDGKGPFYPVTLIENVQQSDPIVQEEVFGPVATLQRFRGEEEALALANGVKYGLAGTIWTQDAAKAARVSEQLESGMVWVNDWLKRDLSVPFGGMKQSGVGREGGKYSLDFYSEVRNIYEAT